MIPTDRIIFERNSEESQSFMD